MKINLNFNFKELIHKICLFWNKYYKLFFVAFSLGLFSWGGYIWYHYLYKFKWGSEKVNQYIVSHEQEIKFREERFEKVINEIERRKNAYSEDAKPVRNILGPPAK